MATFGLIVVTSGLKLRRGDRSGVAPVRLVAACYFLFGLSAFIALDLSPHFAGFMVIGLLAGLPVLGGGPTRSGPAGSSQARITD